MISGKEARLAWANGLDVQISHKNATLKKEWHDLYGTLMLSAFDSDIYEFRLKPRTITINAPKHTAQHISGRKVEITFESHNDASVFFNEMHEVMLDDH